MSFTIDFFAAANPMDHVEDARLFHFEHMDPRGRISQISAALYTLGITKQVALFFVAGVLTFLFFWSYASTLTAGAKGRVPGRWGNFVETVLIFLRDNITRPFLGEAGDKFLPMIATFFVYILVCNLLGLIPLLDFFGHGGNTATANIWITAGLALVAFVMYHALGVKEEFEHHHGEKGLNGYAPAFRAYIKNQFPHVPIFVLPLIIVIEIAAHVIRPCALAIRLYANMTAGHVMIASILGFTAVLTSWFSIGGWAISLISLVAVVALTFLELLVALIQAFVFTFLTTVFLSMAVHPEH